MRLELTVESLPHMCKGLVSTAASGSRNEIIIRACYMTPFKYHFQLGISVDTESALLG